jgi:hypothetical protein
MDMMADFLDQLYNASYLLALTLFWILSTNPIIMLIILGYFVFRIVYYFYKKRKEEQEIVELQETPKISYEELEIKLVECNETVSAMRNSIREKAFRD